MPIDIYQLLRDDHQLVKEIFHQLESTPVMDATKRTALIQQLREELVAHTAAEEETFYTSLGNYSKTSAMAKQSTHEHKEITNLLDRLLTMPKHGYHQWMRIFKELKHMVEAHVRTAEENVFIEAHKVLSDQAELDLASQMSEAKLKERMKARKSLAAA